MIDYIISEFGCEFKFDDLEGHVLNYLSTSISDLNFSGIFLADFKHLLLKYVVSE